MYNINIAVGIPQNLLLYFFVLPYVTSCIAQIVLCNKTKKIGYRLMPLYIAIIVFLIVMLYKYTSALANFIGGFIALFLLGSAVVIVTGSIFGWCIYFVWSKLKHIK